MLVCESSVDKYDLCALRREIEETRKMPRAFLITHRRYNGVEEEITGSERGMLLTWRAVTLIKNF